jgi:hypothetical protein
VCRLLNVKEIDRNEVNWIDLAQVRGKWWEVVKTVANFWLREMGEFLK